MPRASWRGHLRLSLVSCPIYLSPATARAKPIRLHQVWQANPAGEEGELPTQTRKADGKVLLTIGVPGNPAPYMAIRRPRPNQCSFPTPRGCRSTCCRRAMRARSVRAGHRAPAANESVITERN